MIHWLFESVFLGVAWYSILLVINRQFTNNRSKIVNETIDDSVIHIVRYTGLLFIVYLTFSVVKSITDSQHGNYAVFNRMFGAFWFGFWIYPFAYSLLTQLLWVRRIKANNAIRLAIAIILLIALSIEKLITVITSLNRDYIESSWTFMNQKTIASLVSDWFLKLLVFTILVLITTYFIKKKDLPISH